MKTAYPFMLGSLLTLFSCFSKSGQVPIFPQTDNATVKVKALTIPVSQNVISYIISPNKQQLLVATFENLGTITHHPGVGSHLLVFGENGKLEKDVPLNLDLNGALPKMYFADNGLLIMDDGLSITILNTKTDEVKVWQAYSQNRNLHQKEFDTQAEAQSQTVEKAQINKLVADYQLDDNKINVENKNIPAVFWEKYRAIKRETELRTEEIKKEIFSKYVDSLIVGNSDLNGLKSVEYKYLMAMDGTNEGLFRVENEPSQKVNWIKTQRNSLINPKDVPRILNWENGKIQDAENTMTVLEKIETSSVKDAFTGKLANDFVMKLAVGSKTTTFKLKDRAAKIADDGYFSLQNGSVVIMHKNQVYLIY